MNLSDCYMYIHVYLLFPSLSLLHSFSLPSPLPLSLSPSPSPPPSVQDPSSPECQELRSTLLHYGSEIRAARRERREREAGKHSLLQLILKSVTWQSHDNHMSPWEWNMHYIIEVLVHVHVHTWIDREPQLPIQDMNIYMYFLYSFVYQFTACFVVW